MANEIEICSEDGSRVLKQVPLAAVLARSLEAILKRPIVKAEVSLMLLPVPEIAVDRGQPVLRNLTPTMGFGYVTVREEGKVVYRHEHTIGELVVDSLQTVLREAGYVSGPYGFRIAGQSIRPAPAVAGVAKLTPLGDDELPAFQIRKVEEEPLPEAEPADFGCELDAEAAKMPVAVMLHADVRDALIEKRAFSERLEEGGFLVGRVFRNRRGHESHLIEVTDALPAEKTGASLLHFTFTGDSFDAVKRDLRKRDRGERLLGWYHTHLFPASERMGLSTIDVDLHTSTFRMPWQSAGLVNIADGNRTLRFYVWHGNEMVKCPEGIVRERG